MATMPSPWPLALISCSLANMPRDQIRAIEERYAKTETPVVPTTAPTLTPTCRWCRRSTRHFEVTSTARKRLGTTSWFHRRQAEPLDSGLHAGWPRGSEFEPREVVVSTLPGDFRRGQDFQGWAEMVGNIIPFISGEEAKSEKEPLAAFGHVDADKGESCRSIMTSRSLRSASVCLCAHGHTATVFRTFGKKSSRKSLSTAQNCRPRLPN